MENPNATGTFVDGVSWRVWLGGTIQTVWCDVHGGIAVIDHRAWTETVKDLILKTHNELHVKEKKNETRTKKAQQRKPATHDSMGESQKKTQEGQDEE